MGGKSLTAQVLAPPPPPIIADSLEAIWQEEVAGFGAEGGIIGIYIPGKWYGAYAAGKAQITPAVPANSSMQFRAGSLSKSLLATSLLLLQEQGILDLDDLISLWLAPSLSSRIPNANQISVRQVLNHSSGIGNYTSSPGFITTLAIQGTGHEFSPQDLIDHGVAQGPSFPPGSSWEYSNTNYVVAALILEAATGISYENYIQTNLLIPLGLTDSYYPVTDTLPGSYMGSYFDINNSPPKENFSFVDPSGTFGAGALVSTLQDLISWQIALSEGQVLNTASLAEMRTFIDASWPDIDYGLGIGVYNNGTYSSLGHTGSVFNSSNMQQVSGADYYLVYNLTDQDFPHFPFMDRLYNYLQPHLQSCAGFQPGNIAGAAMRGINSGESVLLEGPSQSGTAYQWLQNGQIISGAQSRTYATSLAGNYSVRMSNAQGCVEISEEVSLTNCSPYPVSIAQVDASAQYCAGEAVQLQVAGSYTKVSWLDENNQELSANSPNFNFVAQRNTRFVMQVENNLGCKARDTLEVQLLPLPQSSLGPDFSVCEQTSLELQAGLSGDSVVWYDVAGSLLLTQQNSYSFTLENSIGLIAEVHNSCGIALDTVFIEAISPPNVDLGPDTSIVLGSQISLQAGQQGDRVNWYDGLGNLLLGNSSTFSLDPQGPLTLVAEVITPDNCVGRDSLFIDVTTSVSRPEDIGLQVFPNPSLGKLFLEWEIIHSTEWSWEIVNIQGKKMRSGSSIEAMLMLDIQDFPPGIYLIRIQKGEKQSIQRLQLVP